MILLRCMRYEGYSAIVQNEVQKYFQSEGWSILQDDSRPLSLENVVFGTSLIEHHFFQDPNALSDLESNHWLMKNNPLSEALQHILSRYKPGHMLVDEQGQYWVR